MLGFKEDLLLYYLLIPIKLDPYSTLIGLDFTVGWTSNVSDWYTFLPSRIISFRSARSPLGMNSVTGPPPTIIQRCHLVACPPPCLLAVLSVPTLLGARHRRSGRAVRPCAGRLRSARKKGAPTAPDVTTEMPLSHPHVAAGAAEAVAREGGDARVSTPEFLELRSMRLE
jgi:hypothetical protein